MPLQQRNASYYNQRKSFTALETSVGNILNDKDQPPRWIELETDLFTDGTAPAITVWLTDGGGSPGIRLYFFHQSTNNSMHFSLTVPHTWKEDTDILPLVRWIPNAGGAANAVVNWGLEYSIANDGAVHGPNTTIISANTHAPADASLVADKSYRTVLPAIAGDGLKLGSTIVGRLFRDATGSLGTDDYASTAGLLKFTLLVESDVNRGSRLQYQKWENT